MTQQGSGAARVSDAEARYPVLSTSDRGSRMTQLLPGRTVGRFTAGMLAHSFVAVAAWALAISPLSAAFHGLAPTSLGSPWAVAASLVVVYVALAVTVGLRERVREGFGQARAAGLLTTAVVTGGLAVGAVGWLAASYGSDPVPAFDLANIASSADLPRELGALFGGASVVWAAVAVALLGSALGHARSRQQTIERLRRAGKQYAGELTEVDFRNAWRGHDPLFRIKVSFDAQGEACVVPAHMRTTQNRVPVVGSRMVVLADGVGSVHVELDRSVPIEFEEDDGRYAPSEG